MFGGEGLTARESLDKHLPCFKRTESRHQIYTCQEEALCLDHGASAQQDAHPFLRTLKEVLSTLKLDALPECH